VSGALQSLVREIGGEARTTSVIVAEAFEKQHAHVMRTIRGLLDECPELLSIFGEQFRTAPTGQGGAQRHACYDMNRKGFMLLVMRFTGAKALRMQIAFIDQFDRMEALLSAPVESVEADIPTPAMPMALETPDQFEAMRMKLRTVEAARMAFGAVGARRAWKMAGLPDLSDPDVGAPAGLAVIEALHRSMAGWMASRTEAAPGHREETQTLYADYVGWARDEGYAAAEILSLSSFGKALSRCNVASIKSGRVHRIGLRIAA
jgi:Rha family phage regulatory protein